MGEWIEERWCQERTERLGGVAKRKPVVLNQPGTIDLERELEALRYRNHGRCYHDEEAYSDAIGDVLELLRGHNFINNKLSTDLTSEAACHFCGSRQTAVVHEKWCVNR